jgi:hypothetical protein
MKKMKTIQYYLNNLVKSAENSDYIRLEKIAREVGISYFDYEDFPELKCYFGYSWICTDTKVGLRFYFLDDELVCVSLQLGRKSNEEFEWVSKETYLKVKKLVWDKIIKEDSEKQIEIAAVNLNEDISDLEKYHRA